IVANPGGGRGWPSVVVADVDRNGTLEIVTAHSNGWVTITRADSATLAGWPQQPTSGNELRSLAVGDADNDGDLEILVCSTRSNDQWFLFDHTGSVRTGWPIHSPDSDSNGYAAGCFNENVGLADLDGDGRLEMIGPNDTHYTVGFNDDATPLRANMLYGQIGGQNKVWARVGFHYDHAVDLRGYANCTAGQEPLEPRPNFADSAPSFADVNGDGVLEIIIVGNQYDCRTSPYTSLFHSPYILRADRTRWSGNGFDWTNLPARDLGAAPLSENYNVIETVMPNPVIVDLDGDGFREILYSSYDGRLHAYWLDRTEHGNWPHQIKNPAESFIRFSSEPAIVDLDNDGHAEVIVTTWTQKGSTAGGQLLILSWDGALLHALDLPRATGQTWDGALAAPTLANIDADTDLEVVIGTAHTGLVAYDLPGTANARILWGTGRGNYRRTGAAAVSAPIYLPFVQR
ncbi:MAG: VCBS repeat-containing protein, partial [Anaerolineales bacterium]|nr:VCBS repeat-containing protein [Anaerolineales bacterium]